MERGVIELNSGIGEFRDLGIEGFRDWGNKIKAVEERGDVGGALRLRSARPLASLEVGGALRPSEIRFAVTGVNFTGQA